MEMTREEAIEQLRLGPGINEDVSEEYNNAVNMAIESLALDPQDKSYELWKESYEAEVEKNVRLQQQLDRASALEYEYRMVRSFCPNSYQSGDELDKYLAAGYEFVRASELVPSQGTKAGYIEYILRRKKRDNDD